MTGQAEDNKELPDLLLVDDDLVYCQVMGQALTKRGFQVRNAHNVIEAKALSEQQSPEYAVVDLNMPGASGLTLVKHLIDLDPHTRIVILTGYSSIATAVEAIKLGATHYLSKPADADEVVAAFNRKDGNADIELASQPLSVNRLEWEHIQKILTDHDGNISATARALNMHRRTLQRKLQKRPKKG